MKKTIRLLSVLLLLAMTLTFAACESNVTDSGATSDGGNVSGNGTSSGDISGSEDDSDAKYKDENGNYRPLIGVLDEYKGRTFTVVVRSELYGTYQSDDFTTKTGGNGGIDYGDTFYTQVAARNDMVEELYGVTLEVAKIDNPRQAIEEDAQTGARAYDAAVIHVVEDAAPLAQADLLANLYGLSNFDANAPWWDASANEAYSIGEKLYFTTGDITIMNKANTWCILFNKQMITDYNLEDPYKLFKEGTWTFDKLAEMASTVHNVTDYVADMTNPDAVYGMVTAYGDALEFYGGAGMTLCDKDAENNPSLAFGASEQSVSLAETILTRLRDANWKVYAQTAGVGMQPAFELFWSGRALFRPSGFTAVTKCRSLAKMAFGILPMPKMFETQEEYYTTSHGTFAACVPKNCADPEFSAYMLDAYAAGAKNYITPAYVEVNLLGKSLRDDESEEILYYIYSHILYDVGRIYNFGQVSAIMTNLAKSSSVDVTSTLESVRDSIELEILDLIDDYKENET